jgi:hypothetical protein
MIKTKVPAPKVLELAGVVMVVGDCLLACLLGLCTLLFA